MRGLGTVGLVWICSAVICGCDGAVEADLGTSPKALGDVVMTHGTPVYGKPVDKQTRCEHWHSELDVIAIKFACCGKYYPCRSCHDEVAEHDAVVWPADAFDQPAILCGLCGTELTVRQYMDCNSTCPSCQGAFNPGCRNHYHLYFESPERPVSPAD